MVEQGPLVDGVTGQPTLTVDGLSVRASTPSRCSRLQQPGLLSEVDEHDASTCNTYRGRSAPPGARRRAGTDRRRAWRSGYVQANLVVVPRELAFDFLLFCQRNPKPCPLLDVTEPGSPEPRRGRTGADLRTDLPRYRVYRHGELVDEPDDLTRLVARRPRRPSCSAARSPSRTPCSQAGLPVRHIEAGCNVPMYRTNIACRPAGVFRGPDGGVDAADDAGPGRDRRCAICAPLSARRTARRSTSATRPPSASATSTGPTSATPVELRPGRSAGLLGVRRDAAGGGDGGPAAAADHAQAGAHVRDRPARCGFGAGVSRTVPSRNPANPSPSLTRKYCKGWLSQVDDSARAIAGLPFQDPFIPRKQTRRRASVRTNDCEGETVKSREGLASSAGSPG